MRARARALDRRLAALAPVLAAVLAVVAGCGDAASDEPAGAAGDPEGGVVSTPPPPGGDLGGDAPVAAADPPDAPVVVFLGDSLTAGFGLPEAAAFPAVLDRRLDAEGRPARVINAGVSGDTSAGGLNRLDWLLRQEPDVVVIGLGANDGLRVQDLGRLEANLRAIVERTRAAGAVPLLLGMRIPTNYGPDYAEPFAAIYPRVAEDADVPFVPLVLEGVGGVDAMNLDDGIHPNAAGHARMAENVLPVLLQAMDRAAEAGDDAAAGGAGAGGGDEAASASGRAGDVDDAAGAGAGSDASAGAGDAGS